MEERQEEDGDVILVVRNAAWGLPTACPSCLPSFMYLKLAGVTFSLYYDLRSPDSDDVPWAEFGNMVGFASESGGIVSFLNNQGIADLDADFSSLERAELHSHRALLTSWLHDALLSELWVHENQDVLNQIYFSALPWPIKKFLSWKQQRTVKQRLGINPDNKDDKCTEYHRKATEAYDALSILLGERKFFLKDRPSSLDAFFLAHSLFILQAPLKDSQLKQELLKHPNLVKYSEALRNELFDQSDSVPILRSVHSSSRRTASSSEDMPQASTSSYNAKPKEPKERSEKDKLFRRRAKYFLGAQLAAVLIYLVCTGIVFEEVDIEQEDEDDD